MIANELRAAAALHGWDQPYSPSPLLSPRHVSRPRNDLQVNSRDTSPMVTEPPTPFTPSYSTTQTSIWPGDFNFAQSSGWITGEIPLTVDGRSFMNDTICYTSSEGSISTGIQVPMGSCHEGNLMYDAFSSPSLIHTNPNNGIQASQSPYYVATGESPISKIYALDAMLTYSLSYRDLLSTDSASYEQYISPDKNNCPRTARARINLSISTSIPSGKQCV